MITLYKTAGDFLKSPDMSLLGNVSIDAYYSKFVFGTFTTSTLALLNIESSYEDVIFSVYMSVSDLVPSSKIGLCLYGLTDYTVAENVTFLLSDSSLEYYVNGSLISTSSVIFPLTEGVKHISVKRTGSTYKLLINDTEVFSDTRNNYKQNVGIGITGNNVSLKPLFVKHYTDNQIFPKFAIVGDSISNNSYYTDANSLTGKLKSMGISIREFSGDANVIKDTLDSIHEIIAMHPSYCIIMYGRNDQATNTGRILSDLTTLKNTLTSNNITPIFCTVAYSSGMDVTIPNNIIRNNFFGSNLHIDLEGLYGNSETTDGVHPNTAGILLLRDIIYNYIKNL